MSRMPVRFQTKVLVPVLITLAILLAITIWVVNERFTAEVEEQARERLQTAKTVFNKTQAFRTEYLLTIYRQVCNEPRFRTIATQDTDAATVQGVIAELREELHADFILVTGNNSQPLYAAIHPARTAQLSRSVLEKVSTDSIQLALQGSPQVAIVRARDFLFDIISIPVRLSGAGVVTFGTEFGERAAQEFKQLPHSEIVLLANDQVVASTINKPQCFPELIKLFAASGRTVGANAPASRLLLDSEHFLATAGQFTAPRDREALGYVLLHSYEEPLKHLEATQRLLFTVSVAGSILSAIVLWLLVRNVTRPLRQLRDGAEAVGRGDFSIRVPVTTADECGELATAFNQMTENLKSSREQLEQTVETLRSTQAQLSQTEKLSAVGEFVAGVTHELNNPLTAVIGYGELLMQHTLPPQDRSFLEKIVSSAKRCHRIVQSLLSFSRQHAPEKMHVNVNEIIEATLNLTQYQLRTSNVQVILKLDSQLPLVYADPHQMQQVFLNIISNARQAMEDYRSESSLRISTHCSGKTVNVIFKDNGPGISPENVSKIFDPFFTTKDVGKGTGLGLSVSYGIVKQHGGKITVESELGQGASFIVELPASVSASDTTQETTGTKPALKPAAAGAGKKILVVDDEESILEFTREALASHGYAVDTVQDGQTAFERLRHNRYAAILCDLKMPGLSGQRLFELLEQGDSEAARRMIFMTGDVVSAKSLRFFKSQGRLCLSKPFSMEELLETIKGVANAPSSSPIRKP